MTATARVRRRSLAPIVILLVLAVLIVVLAIRGFDFYRLPLPERPDHEDFRVLSPTGMVGQGYGFAAGILVVLNLAYLIRRRFPRVRLGSMNAWLHAHVLTGLAAGALAIYHSAFQARSDLAVGLLVALGVVIFTGVLGRFLRALATADDAAKLEATFEALDEIQPGLGARVEHAVMAHPIPAPAPGTSFFSGLRGLSEFFRVARARKRAVREEAQLAIQDREMAMMARRILKQAQRFAARAARAPGLARLMTSWRAIHRFFAIAMVLAVLLHAGVAWYYGYRWIFE